MKYPIEVQVVCSNPHFKEKSIGFNKRENAQHIVNRYLFDLHRVKAIHETSIWVNDELKECIWVELINSSDVNIIGSYDEFITLWKTTCNIPKTIKF